MDRLGPRRRRPWLAALLSLILPGLGHLYLGRAGLAGLFYGLWLLPPFVLVTLAASTDGNLALSTDLAVLFSMAVWLLQLLLAAWTARRVGSDFAPRRYNRWSVYVACVVTSLVLDSVLSWALRERVTEAFDVPSVSMVPGLLPGDAFLVRKGRAVDQIRRGDVVVFHAPDSDADYVKRVVALAGDRIEGEAWQLRVNGELLARAPCAESRVEVPADLRGLEPGARTSALCWRERNADGRSYRTALDLQPDPRFASWPEFVVPPGGLFVLGDYRSDSLDSRHFGPVPRAAVIGVADTIYMSRDTATGLRFGRLFKRIE